MDELKQLLGLLSAAENEDRALAEARANTLAKVKAIKARIVAEATKVGLPVGEPHTTDGGKTVFAVSSDGRFSRRPVRSL